MPSHRRRDKIHNHSARAVSTSSLERPVALAGYAMFIVDEVNKLAREATVWGKMPLKVHAHHSPVVVTYTDAGWTTRPDGTSQRGQLVFIANSKLLLGRESNMPLISWHSSRLRRVARSSSAAETQAAADGDDEAVCIHLCFKEVLFGQMGRAKTGNRKQSKFLLLWWWTVVDTTTPWLALRPLVLASKTRNPERKRLRSNKVLLSAAR